MLRNQTFNYEGRYYRVKDVVTNPRPVQQPRPPITIAALGPAMLRITARYADAWNTYPGRGVTPEEALPAIRERIKMLDDLCGEMGRDPNTLSRSLLALRISPTSPFASMQAFHDFMGQYREVGLNDFIFYYPPSQYYPPTNNDQDALFESIARGVMPAMKAK